MPLADVPIDLNKPIFVPVTQNQSNNQEQADDEDLEFELLATESLSKTTNATVAFAAPVIPTLPAECNFNAFETE